MLFLTRTTPSRPLVCLWRGGSVALLRAINFEQWLVAHLQRCSLRLIHRSKTAAGGIRPNGSASRAAREDPSPKAGLDTNARRCRYVTRSEGEDG